MPTKLIDLPRRSQGAFSALVKQAGFVCVTHFADASGTYFVARPYANVCYYIAAEQFPTGGVRVTFRVAPPDCPDGSLDSLFIGYRIEIITDVAAPLDALTYGAARISLLLPHVSGLARATEIEYANPVINTTHQRTYLTNRRAVAAIQEYAATSQGEYCRPVLTAVHDFVDGGTALQDWLRSIREIVDQLIQDPHAPPIVHDEVYRDRTDRLVDGIWRQLFINTLVPFRNSSP